MSQAGSPAGGPALEDERGVRHLLGKARRHWEWGQEQGWRRLIEEDQLDPVERASTAMHKWRWRRRHGVARGTATGVYLVGVQRSGTNMLVRGLEASPEFEVHNENDRRAFERFQLRSDETVRGLLNASRHRYVLFKPLCDSHRTDELLEIATARPSRAIWAYRHWDGRVRSAVAKFGDTNLRVLREIANGGGTGRWQAQRLSPKSMTLIRSLDYARMTPESAAALFWYVRNALFFELALDERPDVALVSYEALVARPTEQMRRLCSFLQFPFDPGLVAHVTSRAPATARETEIDPVVREHVEDLQRRLDALAG